MGKSKFFIDLTIQIDMNFEIKQTKLKSIIQHENPEKRNYTGKYENNPWGYLQKLWHS